MYKQIDGYIDPAIFVGLDMDKLEEIAAEGADFNQPGPEFLADGENGVELEDFVHADRHAVHSRVIRCVVKGGAITKAWACTKKRYTGHPYTDWKYAEISTEKARDAMKNIAWQQRHAHPRGPNAK